MSSGHLVTVADILISVPEDSPFGAMAVALNENNVRIREKSSPKI